ncbi:uncharacterized protein MELLADRAFT_95648 [Melampsora larici-populina 98AG31]|uniref:F-box domain-containing protein n=1 Tax=Melampsora larici-populina (strain 98AG31 / pathotype 3-4-7) TaxID=747676 RepID=F4SA30_MELLP|nr:uncharacterized protein MELLADRAFT_95648 [Melampsora larici-populina 98AG31]EGF98476.1 hypothetical protein MELLADRAFT_95648 [Melampsora larici-populina 98AG31]
MFSPYLFQCIDFQGFAADKLKLLFQGIIKRHSEHFREIRSRFSYPNEPDKIRSRFSHCNEPDGNPKSRTDLLIEILETSPHLTNIDIDLDPEPHLHATSRDVFYFLNWQSSTTANKISMSSIKSISQLKSLTHLSISSPSPRPPYAEDFLAEILSDLSQLQSFACSSIDATHPKPLDNQQTCRSPLGIHLALLTDLVELELKDAKCFDASWIQLDWKSSLKALSLEGCDRVSLSGLNGFLELFKATLKTLTFVEALGYEQDTWNRNHNDRLWPNLKKLEINSHSFSFRRAVEGITDLCQGYSIEIVFNVDFYNDEDEIPLDTGIVSTYEVEPEGYMYGTGSHGGDWGSCRGACEQ